MGTFARPISVIPRLDASFHMRRTGEGGKSENALVFTAKKTSIIKPKSLQLRGRTISVTTKMKIKCTEADSVEIETTGLEFQNPVGLHAMVWVGGWSREESEKAIRKSAEIGYDLIEVPVFNPEAMDLDFTKSVLENHGMQSSTSLGLSLDADVSSADSEISARGEQKLLDALDAAAAIGAKYLTGVTHSAIAKYPVAFQKGGVAHRNLLRALRNVATRAADKGIIFGLEVVNRYESNVLNTASQAVELVEEIGHRNVVIHLDSYHMNIEEGSLADAVAVCGDRLGYVHIGESHRGYLGTGTIDFSQIFRALARAEYTGPITFESFSSAVVSADLSNTLCVWRNLWEDSEDLSRHAIAYIKSQGISASRALGR